MVHQGKIDESVRHDNVASEKESVRHEASSVSNVKTTNETHDGNGMTANDAGTEMYGMEQDAHHTDGTTNAQEGALDDCEVAFRELSNTGALDDLPERAGDEREQGDGFWRSPSIDGSIASKDSTVLALEKCEEHLRQLAQQQVELKARATEAAVRAHHDEHELSRRA